ncbi:MAG TPA: SpaH/EbpB family LPXTG-anchored major pilin [Pseudogracilibacillus sp.]|nr:SpaH/EbpB family LPXTG-anchored major pilin [Pseudogracilibacillus sp.]
MKRKFSIYHFLIALMMFTLILPAFAGAEAETGATERETGSLTIHKFEQEPGASVGAEGDGSAGQSANGKPLAGVTYEVKQTHSFNPATDEWTEVTAGETYTMTTDANGQVSKDLPLGRYSVGEIEGPAHVNLNPDTFYVDIPMTSKDGSSLNYDVHIYPKNETIRGAVELTKRDGDSAQALAGVQFKLYHADGTVVAEELFVTDANGKFTVDGLAYGDYYFKEIATLDDYLLGSQKVDFSITESGKTVKVDVKNYQKPDVKKSVDETAVNRGEVVTYTISVDLPGDIKDYKSFVVTDTLHENLEFVEVVSQPNGFTFNQDGQTLTWTATPSELSGPGTVEFKFKAKVSEEAEANVEIDNKAYIDYENQHGTKGEKETEPVVVTPTAGSLTVIKQDGKSKETLAGAEFDLIYKGAVIAKGTSNANGIVEFDIDTSQLDYGDYQLKETKAPNEYRLLTKPIDFTIGEGEQSEVTITVDNFKSGWELPTTGGIGTMLFTFIGLSLMGGASVMFLRRRKGASA